MKTLGIAFVIFVFCMGCGHNRRGSTSINAVKSVVPTTTEYAIKSAVLTTWLNRTFDPSLRQYVDSQLMSNERYNVYSKADRGSDEPGVILDIFSINVEGDVANVGVETLQFWGGGHTDLLIDLYVLKRMSESLWKVVEIKPRARS